jgi:DUF4097 and DUF4098 domain-containing protein YvlB
MRAARAVEGRRSQPHKYSHRLRGVTETTPRLRITRRSGRVRVLAESGALLAVDGGTFSSGEDGVVEIRARVGSALEVHCPAGTDLTISTSSGAIDVQGDAGSVKVTTSSGALAIERATAVDARGASGRVDIGACAGECKVVLVSSNVHIREAGHARVATVSGNIEVDAVDDAEVKTVSGSVTLGSRGGGRLAARTISGSIGVSVPVGSRPATRLAAISGRVRSDCEAGHEGEIRAKSVSGSISVTCR